MGKKVQKEDTLGVLEAVVEGKADFKKWGPFEDIEIFEWDGFVPDLGVRIMYHSFRLVCRTDLTTLRTLTQQRAGYNKLPQDALDAIQRVVDQAGQLKQQTVYTAYIKPGEF